MMGKMVKNMIYFVVLLLIVLMSFGVARQAILFPDKEPSWGIARDVFLEPYFMLYGEVYANKIDPPCGPGEEEEVCKVGRWISPTIMSIYLLVANILLINLLIAVFNNIFNEVNAIAHQVWMFQRFTVVMEYEQKPILPPPFIAFSHIYLLWKYLKRKMTGLEESYDNGLKLFFDRDEMELLYDFEEDCVEGFFAEQELKLQQSTEERIKVTTERIEHLTQKIEDINTKENANATAMQNFEMKLRRQGDDLQNALLHMSQIHRILVLQQSNTSNDTSEDKTLKEITVNDNIEGPVDESIIPLRKRIMRSLTEVRPDAYIFDNGTHIEYRHAEEDEDLYNEQIEVLSQSGSQHQNLNRQRKRSSDSKTSIESTEKLVDSKDVSTDDLAALSLDVLRSRAAQRRRDSTSRRSSEGGNGEDSIHGSRLNLTKRQLSQTQSEPDNIEATGGTATSVAARNNAADKNVTFLEPKIKIYPPTAGISQNMSNRASMLMHMHSEYTSITDELESVCGLLSPPRSPGLLSPPRPEQSPPSQRRRHASEMSNPEIAINLEKEHLRSAEESDYMVMEDLIQRRFEEEDEDEYDQNPNLNAAFLNVVSETAEFHINSWPLKTLVRSRAVDNPSQGSLDYNCVPTERQGSTESADIPCFVDQASIPKRPSIVVDSSQLPLHREIVQKTDSKDSLHMQSETMC